MFRAAFTMALATSVLLVAARAEASSHPVCAPRHSFTVAANREVRVYAVVDHYGGRTVWACYLRTERRFKLGTFDPHDIDYPDRVKVRLAGRLVGSLTSHRDHYGEGDLQVVVRDVRTGTILHRAEKQGNDLQEGAPAWDPARFVMDRAGSVAWTATATEVDGAQTYYVFESDSTRWAQQADAGPDLDPESLRRHGKTLTWTKGGTTRAAQFVR